MPRAVPLRVLLLSDTHGQLDERIAAQVRASDIAVHAGDIGCAAVVRALTPRSGKVICVRGNNDVAAKWPSADQALLEKLPEVAELELPGGVLAVVHGHRAGAVAGRHDRLRAQFPEARAIVYGHSHRLTNDQEKGRWVLNPGAAGRSRTYGGPSCLLLHVSPRIWRVEILRYPPT